MREGERGGARERVESGGRERERNTHSRRDSNQD